MATRKGRKPRANQVVTVQDLDPAFAAKLVQENPEVAQAVAEAASEPESQQPVETKSKADAFGGDEPAKKQTKNDMIFAMLLREKGCTHKELCAATGWVKCQQHPKDVARKRGHQVAVRTIGRIAHYKAFKADDAAGIKDWQEGYKPEPVAAAATTEAATEQA